MATKKIKHILKQRIKKVINKKYYKGKINRTKLFNYVVIRPHNTNIDLCKQVNLFCKIWKEITRNKIYWTTYNKYSEQIVYLKIDKVFYRYFIYPS